MLLVSQAASREQGASKQPASSKPNKNRVETGSQQAEQT